MNRTRKMKPRLNDYRLNVTGRARYRYPQVPIAFVGFNSTHDISFRTPNVTAMLLDESYTSWEESKKYFQGDHFSVMMNFKEARDKKYYLKAKSEHRLFDMIQKRMISIVFAFTAIESFSNESIPNEYIFRDEKTKFTEVYIKSQAEFLNLEVKLHKILPQIFHIESPKNSKIWNQYNYIKNMRDRIIHIKEKDKVVDNIFTGTIWSDLLDNTNQNIALDAKAIIGYFLDNISDPPRWYLRLPW